MVDGFTAAMVERVVGVLRRARNTRNWRLFQGARRILLALLMFVQLTQLRSPRYYYVSGDMRGGLVNSFWRHLRHSRRDGALLRFLGVPFFMFDKICERARAFLPRFDRTAPVGFGRGRRSTFDHVDVIAVALRRLQMAGTPLKFMEIDFATVDSTLSGSHGIIEVGRRALLQAIREWDPAAVRYPTLKETQKAWHGVVTQLGPPPMNTPPVVLLMDGTTTPIFNVSNIAQQRLFVGSKGRTENHILVFCADGTISDYSIGNPGCMHDSRVAEQCIARHQDLEINVHGVAMVVDSGFRGHAHNGTAAAGKEGLPPIWRPLQSEMVPAHLLNWYKKCSAWTVSYRQYNEHGNAGFKKAFPLLSTPCLVSDRERRHVDFLTCIFLWNARTRMVGYNQIRTKVLGHTDDHLHELLSTCTNVDEYMRLAAQRWAEVLE
jgi:hypothetical protein